MILFALSATNVNAFVKILGNQLANGATYTSSNVAEIKSGSITVSSDGLNVTFNNLNFVYDGSSIRLAIYLSGGDVNLTLVGENSITTKGGVGLFLGNENTTFVRTFTITGGSLTVESVDAGLMYQGNNIINLVDTKYESKCGSTSSSDKSRYCFIDCNNTLGGWNNTGYLNIKNSTVIGHQPTDKYGFKINKLEMVDCLVVEPFLPSKLEVDPTYTYGYHIYCGGEISEFFEIRPYTAVTINSGPEGDLNHDGFVNTGDVSRLYQLILK